ncbi:MAG: M56 family metallopeptidase [Mucilaginibacter sp.]
METLLYNISQVLGITIIHSLWQGLLVYIALRIVFAASSSLTAVKKYNWAVAASLAITACFIYTLFAEIKDYSWVTLKPHQHLSLLPYLALPATTHYQTIWYAKLQVYLPYICAVYFTGFTINIARLVMEWGKLRQVKSTGLPAVQLQQYINTAARKLNIGRQISVKFSELIDVPCMIGYFKPLILLPVSICTNLSAEEVEAIILHELSHIKRNDYLMNLLQQVITVLLFFNPFTQLINRIINQERENGCDDLVVEETGEPLVYAQALIKLEEARRSNFQLALAATGKKFHLLNRIERIMKTKKHIGSVRHFIVALFLLTGSLSCIAWFNPKTALANIKHTANSVAALIRNTDSTYSYSQDTTKRKHKGKAISKTKSQKLKAEKLKSEKDQDFTENYWDDEYLSDSAKRFFRSPQWKQQMENIRKQFNSQAWKNQMMAMQKQFNSPEWKKHMEDMSKQFNSPEWKKQMEDMGKQFNSPEWKKQMEDIGKQFNSPEWKEKMKEYRKGGKYYHKRWKLRDTVGGTKMYVPEKDTVDQNN